MRFEHILCFPKMHGFVANLTCVPQITWLLLGDVVIPSKTDLRGDSKKEK